MILSNPKTFRNICLASQTCMASHLSGWKLWKKKTNKRKQPKNTFSNWIVIIFSKSISILLHTVPREQKRWMKNNRLYYADENCFFFFLSYLVFSDVLLAEASWSNLNFDILSYSIKLLFDDKIIEFVALQIGVFVEYIYGFGKVSHNALMHLVQQVQHEFKLLSMWTFKICMVRRAKKRQKTNWAHTTFWKICQIVYNQVAYWQHVWVGNWEER